MYTLARRPNFPRQTTPGRSASDRSPVSPRGTLGNRDVQRLMQLQRKPTMSSPGDRFEQEADRAADSVMRTPAQAPAKQGCACAGAGGGTCATCGKPRGETPHIQRLPSAQVSARNSEASPESVNRTLAKSGTPIASPARAEMEGRFHQDFSRVRVHTDAEAARSARDVQARAYTVGRNIVFGAGEYSPSSPKGKGLLAHELTHVVQQGGNAGASAAPRMQRKPIGGPGQDREHGSTLPYRDAMQLNECVRIMGPENLEYCQREALGHDVEDSPLAVRARRVSADLTNLVAGATWKEIRKRVYPRESAAGVERGRKRKRGLLPDLTGLGSLTRLESFATGVRGVQRDWGPLSADDRVEKLGKVANGQLRAVNVPGFQSFKKERMESKGGFLPTEWRFVISEALVTPPALDDMDAADITNLTAHESRHAEQSFLAARFSAGNNNNAATIASQLHIPAVIAERAVARKFDSGTPIATSLLGSQMFDAKVTRGRANQLISNDDGWAELARRKTEAETALSVLNAAADASTLSEAILKRNALRDQIVEVEKKYTRYRSIPYEADAHEVGDAAELAFNKWK